MDYHWPRFFRLQKIGDLVAKVGIIEFEKGKTVTHKNWISICTEKESREEKKRQMDTWNTKLFHTRERWSYYKDVNKGCTSLPTNSRRKTHVPPGERQTVISVRRQLPLSKFLCLRQTFFLPKPISLPSSTSRLTCLKMGTVFHCPFANYLTFFLHNLKPVFYCFFPNLLRIFPNPQL